MEFNLKNYTPYELSKINNTKIQSKVKPSKFEYDNVMNIINNELTKEQYEQLYSLFIVNLPVNKISKTSTGIMFDLEKLSIEEFYRLENIICDFIYETPTNTETISEQSIPEMNLTPNCDYTDINKDLYVDDNIKIKTQQPLVANYLELYDIQRSLPSLKKD